MYRPDLETASPAALRDLQLKRLRALFAHVLPANAFYRDRLRDVPAEIDWAGFERLPFTTKAELVEDQAAAPPLGRIATYDATRYVTYHQTSGTTGRPMTVLDTAESWDWWVECWQYVLCAAGVTPADRVFFAFSFGPFIGFWSAHAGARRLGALAIPSGGMDSKARLEMLLRTGATVLVSTPTYALRLAEIARADGIAITESAIRLTIHAGEAGASIPSVRNRIEEAWNARSFDHAGGTEVGAHSYSCSARDGLHVNEAEFIAEVLDPTTHAPVAPGETGELVLTNLGRAGWPVIRYRTGDLVTAGGRECACGRTFLKLPGGIRARVDDLMIVRGVNIFPSAIEAIVRTFPVEEYRIVRLRRNAMEEVLVEVEAESAVAAALADTLRQKLAVRLATRAVPRESLPRWELKSRRVVDLRDDPAAVALLAD